MHAFTDVALAAYCPRKLYYRRREDAYAPPEHAGFELAFRYPSLLDPETALDTEPIAVTPVTYRQNLNCSRARLRAFEALCEPTKREAFLTGRQTRGIAHKVLVEPLAPSIVSVGEPPDTGVWEPHAVRAVAAAKALAWERKTSVQQAFVEYATHGVIRKIELTPRRVGQYRRALRTAASIDGPPPRTRNTDKCESCEYRAECGVRTRSLRSLLGGR
ncbi:CRISPR-associated protein Cas4 [Halocatena pleomorpha]|uniref:Dna2/Cas4 domain-containing protein n=1 Tax=Halocatena pleomorpha TaxID=1785090 RepID=A0A3P3RD10_9EURY|nr:hypothetical protein [Halocatena pleomorpha]RRJ30353.1 hypothetical protein EIK79_10570 [Halocatena pleomorpha]